MKRKRRKRRKMRKRTRKIAKSGGRLGGERSGRKRGERRIAEEARGVAGRRRVKGWERSGIRDAGGERKEEGEEVDEEGKDW